MNHVRRSCAPSTAALNMHVVNRIVNQISTLCDHEQYDHQYPLGKDQDSNENTPFSVFSALCGKLMYV